MIKRIKKFIRGGDTNTVEAAIEIVNRDGEPSCTALRVAGAEPRFLSLYKLHSGAFHGMTGFADISRQAWVRLLPATKKRIRIERLSAFKESLK